MEFILIILVLGALGFWGYRMYKKKQVAKITSEHSAPATLHVPYEKPLDFADNGMDPSHDLMRIQPGDALYYSMDLEFSQKIVLGVLTCIQYGSPAWLSVLLDDNTWISIEPGVRAEVTRWINIDLDEDNFPTIRTLKVEHGGVTYKRNDWGEATYTSTGNTGLPASGILEFGEFRSPEGPDGTIQALSYEKYDDGDWSLSKGEAMIASALQRNPGSDASV